jgi:capsid protein
MNALTEDDTVRRLNRRLTEAWQSLWDSFVDPRDAISDGGSDWIALGSQVGAGGAASIPFGNEQELGEIRAQCRNLALGNEFAINGHENRISFLVGPGHTYRATLKKNSHASQPANDSDAELANQTQAVLDAFIAENHWQRRQQEIVRRYDRDGEVFLRFFTSGDGQTRVRFVEPGQVATPKELAGDPAASFGIQTEPDDVETALAYYIDGQPVDAADVQHRKANVDANVKRGLPLFYPVRKNLRRAEKLLRNMSVVAEIQSAIALVRKHRGATRASVQQFAASQADVSVTSPATGQTANFRRFGPGTILDSHGGIEYDFPASGLDAANFVAVLQAELRAIASRLVMPEFMLTSDASNANYASTMVAEGPAIRMFARLQAELMSDDLQVMRRVVQNAVQAGRLPHEALTRVEIQASPPTLAVRDALKEAQAFRIEYQSGILSPQTWSQRRGLDYDQEQTNWREAQSRAAAPASSNAAEKV